MCVGLQLQEKETCVHGIKSRIGQQTIKKHNIDLVTRCQKGCKDFGQFTRSPYCMLTCESETSHTIQNMYICLDSLITFLDVCE